MNSMERVSEMMFGDGLA